MTEHESTDDEVDRNEDPRAVSGAVTGATAGTVGGGLGLAAGPLGVVIGALAGFAGGWWAGREAHDALERFDRLDDRLGMHARAGGREYEEIRHAYQLGYLAGRNPRYEGEGFEAAATDLRTAWIQSHAHVEDAVGWDDVHASVRRGFEEAREQD